jgi:ketosteroid isomerase-like protein
MSATTNTTRTLLAVILALTALGCRSVVRTNESPSSRSAADERAIREARASQNRAIASNDLDRVSGFWTEDVEIRRGLGQLLVGRNAYRQLFVATGNRDSILVYQREPNSIEVSSKWPLAYESGTWTGYLGSLDGPSVIQGRYSAQWVRRAGTWLIRGEVFVALTCAGVGCTYSAAP